MCGEEESERSSFKTEKVKKPETQLIFAKISENHEHEKACCTLLTF